MHMFRFFTSSFACAALVSLTWCGPSTAEPILLAEWKSIQSGKFANFSPPATIPFRFKSFFEFGDPSGSFIGGTWTQDIGHGDVGDTFEAPSDMVERLQDPFRYNAVRFGGGVGNQDMDIVAPLSGWQTEPTLYTQHVVDLTQYRVVRFTRTVEMLVLEPTTGGNHLEGGNQTIRLYGELIPPLAGDYNSDGDIDDVDYVVWRDRIASNALMPNGTGQGLFAGRAVQEDYDYWRANYGRTAFPPSATGIASTLIPEPNTVALAVIAILAMAHGRRWHGLSAAWCFEFTQRRPRPIVHAAQPQKAIASRPCAAPPHRQLAEPADTQ